MYRAIGIFLLGILLVHSTFAEKNFWGNDICNTDRDCSGLTTCDYTFGCTTSVWKVALVVVGVFVAIVLIIITIVWLCIRNLCNNRFRRPNNLPQTTFATSTTAWNQQQMGAATAVYPTNTYPSQPYANSVHPPPYNPYPTDDRVGGGAGMNHNHNQMPSAPYSPTSYDGYPQESQTYHPKH